MIHGANVKILYTTFKYASQWYYAQRNQKPPFHANYRSRCITSRLRVVELASIHKQVSKHLYKTNTVINLLMVVNSVALSIFGVSVALVFTHAELASVSLSQSVVSMYVIEVS